jgi:hypothetical protein
MNHNIFDCPSCGSESTQKLSSIRRDGITRTSGKAQSTFGGSYKISGLNVSETSRMAAPPQHPISFILTRLFLGIIVWIGITLLASRIISQMTGFFSNVMAIIWFLITLFISLKYVLWDSIVYTKKYPANMHRWNNSYFCSRCDTVFSIPK